MVQSDNQHPVDVLAALREDIRRLKDREREMRDLVLELSQNEREGKAHRAIVVERDYRRLDEAALRRELGERLDEFFVTRPMTLVKVQPLRGSRT